MQYSELHKEYLKYFRPNTDSDKNNSLAQPSPYKYVPSIASDAVIDKSDTQE